MSIIKNMEPTIEIAIFSATGSIVLIAIIAIAIAICRKTTGNSKKENIESESDFSRNHHQQQLPGISTMIVCARINEIQRIDAINSSYIHYDSPKPEPRYCFKNPAFEIDEFVTHLEGI